MGLTQLDLRGQYTAPPGALYALTTMGHQDVADEYVTSDTNAAAVQASIQGRTAPRLLAPETIFTPLRPLEFERKLASHPNKDFVQDIVQGIMSGVKIGYSGPQMSLISSNLPSAHLNSQVIEDSLQKECEAGRLAGPFPVPPLHNFRSSGIGLIPKKDGGWRVIHHLSAPVGRSINDFIDPKAFSLSYPSVDEAAAILVQLG